MLVTEYWQPASTE